jgi:ABC-type glycerol-3-phosphate transport system substrate-binding protein
MMPMNTKTHQFLTIVLTASILTACGNGQEGNADGGAPANKAETDKQHEPVVLKLYPGQMIIPEDMTLMINEPLQKKYPYITVEVIDRTNNSLENQIISGGQMDLITTWNGSMASSLELDTFEDLLPLTKKNGIDLSKFDDEALSTIRAISDDGHLYGLPYNRQFNAIFYNKDIFDKFGVQYPKDGMFWEDAIELSKRLTRQETGTTYRGLDPEGVVRMMFPLSVNVVNAKTNKADVNSEIYKKLFEMAYQVYAVPGNKPAKWGQSAYTAFTKDRNVAMSAMVNLFPTICLV